MHAVAAGTIIRVQRRGVGGLEILVQHPGFVAVYSHLGRVTPAIANGRRSLAAGEIVGVIGRTGVTYGTHLYFGMIVDGRPVRRAYDRNRQQCGAQARQPGPARRGAAIVPDIQSPERCINARAFRSRMIPPRVWP